MNKIKSKVSKLSLDNEKPSIEFINNHLSPKEYEKKTFGEVFTPLSLVEEMLDKITDFYPNYWSNPNLRILDPANGMGNFPFVIYKKLMKGLSGVIKDKEQRKKHILEKMLYMIELNPKNIKLCKKIFEVKKYKLNLIQGDALSEETLDKLHKKLQKNDGKNVELKFDLIVGNPPYNNGIYKLFIELYSTYSDLLLFVIPSNFTIGVSHSKFINVLKNNGLLLINYLDRNIWKNKIDIDTLYFLLKKNYNKKIIINNIKTDRTNQILNIDKIYYNILKKINNHNKFILLKGKNDTLNYNDKIETENIKFNYSNTYKYKLLSRLNGGKELEIFYIKNFKEDYIHGYKLLMPRSTGSYNSINSLKNLNKPIVFSKIDKEPLLLSKSIVYFKFNTYEEADKIQWYIMNSKFVRFLFIKENKFSELTKGMVNLIPFINYKIIKKCDKDVYKYFKFSEKEIEYIENTLKVISYKQQKNNRYYHK